MRARGCGCAGEKRVEKSAKKVLTNARKCSILTELSAREQLEADAMILENDTE